MQATSSPLARGTRRPSRAHRVAIALICLVVTAPVLPRLVSGRQSDSYFRDDLHTQRMLADRVAAGVSSHTESLFYHTRSSRFDGQSAIAIYQMTILGLGQVILAHPEMRNSYLPVMDAAAEQLIAPETLTYATEVYGHHGTQRMLPIEGHAYMGYINLALGMLRKIDPDSRHAALHDRITESLAERLFASPTGLIETYPEESWPPDVAAVAGSIGLHSQATGHNRTEELEAWARRFSGCAIDNTGS